MSTAEGHLVFSSAQSLYGVPTFNAVEVLSPTALTRIPGAPSHVLGVYAHRGELVPVVDLGVLLHVRTVENAEAKRAVLVRGSRGSVAIGATEVIGVNALEESAQPLGEDGVYACLRGPVTTQAGQVVLVMPEQLIEFLARFE